MSLRLAVVLPARTAAVGGVQRYAEGLVDALRGRADVVALRVHPEAGEGRLLALRRGVAAVRAAGAERPLDAVLTTFHWPPRLWAPPTVGMVHDLRALRERPRPALRLAQTAVVRTWAAVLTPSAHVADDVRELLRPRRVLVAGAGADHLDPHLPATPPRRDAVVVLGGAAEHKRTPLALEAGARAAEVLGAPLLVVGGVPDGIAVPGTWLRGASDAEVVAAVSRARVAVTGTAYEGFGLAVAEALRAGCPVVHPDDVTMPFVADGGSAAPPDVEALAGAAVRLARDGEAPLRAQRVARDLTWGAVAERVLSAVRAEIEG